MADTCKNTKIYQISLIKDKYHKTKYYIYEFSRRNDPSCCKASRFRKN